jgi:hypothetical protein
VCSVVPYAVLAEIFESSQAGKGFPPTTAYIYIYMYIYILYVCMYVCMYIYIYIYIYIYVCMYMLLLLLCVYICMLHVCVCVHVCMYVCMYVFMYVCTYVCVYIYIYIHAAASAAARLPSVSFFFCLFVLRARAVVTILPVIFSFYLFCCAVAGKWKKGVQGVKKKHTRHADELTKLEEVIFFQCFFVVLTFFVFGFLTLPFLYS